MMAIAREVGPELGVVAVCTALGLARATYYRQLEPTMHGPAPKKFSPRELAIDEKKAVLGVLHEDRFVDLAPAEVYATLLDEGRLRRVPANGTKLILHPVQNRARELLKVSEPELSAQL